MLLYTAIRKLRVSTLYFKFSRPSRSMLFAQDLAIHIAHHITLGITPIQSPSSPDPLLTSPLRKTTPARTPFNTGINRRGPSSGFLGSTLCFNGRKYAVYAVSASDVIPRRDIWEGIMINTIVGTRESIAKDFWVLVQWREERLWRGRWTLSFGCEGSWWLVPALDILVLVGNASLCYLAHRDGMVARLRRRTTQPIGVDVWSLTIVRIGDFSPKRSW